MLLFKKYVLSFFIVVFIVIFPDISLAGISTDGTMGQSSTLTGPNYTISSSLGTTVGTNLFHSFTEFNIYTGESAAFTGSSSIENIISRVTGGSSSYIDGTISCSWGANLYFINPWGVVFGKNASLDVKGSFYVSTADYIKLGGGGKFSATNPSDTILTVSSPVAFGFLSNSPAAIKIDGSFLEVSKGQTIAVVAGDVEIKNGYLYAPEGKIEIASVASGGEAEITTSGITVDSFSALGDINITHDESTRKEIDSVEIGNLDVSGDGGGSIYIRGGNLVMDGAMINSNTYGDKSGGVLDIRLKGDMSLENSSYIFSFTEGAGKSGDITIETGDLNVTGGSQIGSATYGTGQGGNITINASGTINISGYYSSGDSLYRSSIITRTYGDGDAGNITIETGNLNIANAGTIAASASSYSTGNGGDIYIKATDTINISGYYDSGDYLYLSNIASGTSGSGNAGNINIETSNLNLTNSAQISTTAYTGSTGNGGNITIKATGTINISGFYDYGTAVKSSGIYTVTTESGNAGNITIETGNLSITDVGAITSSAYEDSTGNGGDITINASGSINISGSYTTSSGVYYSGILGDTYGSGYGGNLKITANSIYLSDGGEITSESLYGTGDAGDIEIKTYDSLILNNGNIKTSSQSASGGNITINGSNIQLLNTSAVSSSVKSGTDKGGNIAINSDTLCVLDSSYISADADLGYGGDVTINAAAVFLWDSGSALHASSAITGQEGKININSPLSDITGSLISVKHDFLNVEKMLPESCENRRKQRGSFVITGKGNIVPKMVTY
ncbi:MAG: filamentous hemagglutinin N-terminal domain-containing protein [Nitrospirae bacterium YQR-1]